MVYDKNIFKHNVYTIRKKTGLSQERFGEMIGVSQKTISSYEVGENPNPRLDTLILLAKYANSSIEALLTLRLDENLFNHGMRKPNNSSAEYSFFEGMTYYVYYLTESIVNPFYKGYIKMDDKYDGEHAFLHGKAFTGHEYDCKMVIEGTDNFFIYGTEIHLPRRFHLQMYYPDLSKEDRFQAGLGILSRLNTSKQIAGMRLAVTSKELDLQDLTIRDELKFYLTTGDNPDRLASGDSSCKITVNHDLDNKFRDWINSLK